jgi:magnesium-transporting ATPase (P-type)
LAFLLLGSSVITTSVNYILLYISYKKIKEIAERIVSVDVLRDGKYQTIPSNHLAPGDLFVPSEEMLCDSILLRGEVYVNEANLTG